MNVGANTAQTDLYRQAADQFGAAVERLAAAYEADPERRRDLAQDIHFQLWRSFAHFDGRCSMRTWVYQVGHRVGASHVLKERRTWSRLVSLEDFDPPPDRNPVRVDGGRNLERLHALIQQLKPLDRQVILSYLEGLDAASTGEITGLSPANVAMKIHRIKNILAKRFHEGGSHVERPS